MVIENKSSIEGKVNTMKHKIRIKKQFLVKKSTFSLIRNLIQTLQKKNLMFFMVKVNFSIQYS